MKLPLMCLIFLKALSFSAAYAESKPSCVFSAVVNGCTVLHTIINGQATSSIESGSPSTPACTFPSSLPPTSCARIVLCKKQGMDECMINYGSASRAPASNIGNAKCGINGKPARLQMDGMGPADQCVR